ncbi:MAG: DNA adenine methylase [Clostridiales bacterium]|nr:DNA adenine methylase [Clostridiales bacterium]
MGKAPHLVQYQGSKRLLAPEIIRYFPDDIQTLYEPFSGTCAVTILAAQEHLCDSFVVNDINAPLIGLMQECIENPNQLAEAYSKIWNGQYKPGENNIDYFYKIRDQFNSGQQDPARMLFVLARVVKGAVRYNADGVMNQSCDKRRYGTKPEIVAKNANAISKLLKGKTQFFSLDYKEIFKMATPEDLIYMDPPYQGTSNREDPRDNRYIAGVQFEEFVEALRTLNERNIRYIVSYDGQTGDKVIGKSLPDDLNLKHLLVNAGVSAQATLMGKKAITYESLYLSPGLVRRPDSYHQLSLFDLIPKEVAVL